VVIVDTSVWVEVHRHPRSDDATTLKSLLDTDEVALALPVRIEYVASAARKDRPKLRRALAALPLLVPSEETWQVVESWRARGHDAGHTFGVTDLLIAALTNELTGLVWSLDKDFVAMEKLGFVRCY
jgi:predicted nucleic acid-binding protein